MKTYLSVVFFILSSVCFSQKKSEININKAKLSEAKLLSELIDYSFKDNKAISWEMIGKVGGKANIVNAKGDTLNEIARNILKNVELGSKVFIDIESGNKKSKSNTFTIRVVE